MAETFISLLNAGVALGGNSILSGINFSLGAAERVVVLGANGAGKSTFLRLAHGLAPLDTGTRKAPPAAQQAMLFQRPALLRRSALANVEFVLAAYNVPTQQLRSRADVALAACGLAHVRDQFARSLSGGEQQRLALACAWGIQPRVLFADEPTASLDLHAVRAVEASLLGLNAQGCAMVMTTHNLAQAKRLAQRIIFLHNGTIADDVSASQFFAGAQSAHANAFFEGEKV